MNIATKENKYTKPYSLYILFALVSFLFLFFFSIGTSPLYELRPESDSDIFIMLGKLFREGYTPYIEFFDHKGPIIIFIEALGISLFPNERLSIFIFQIINLFFIQILIFKIASIFLNKRNSITVIICTLLFLSLLLPPGNYTEEWSLSFLFLALLYGVQFFLSDSANFSRKKTLILGLSFGIIFWLRVNNASVICAVIMYIFFIQLSKKDWTGIANLIIYFILGFTLITLPIVAYFLYIDAFDEMIYATFLFNFKYSALTIDKYHNSISVILESIISEIVPFIILILGAILLFIKTRRKSIFLFVILLLFWSKASTYVNGGFTHYMILNLPLLAIGISLVISGLDCLNKRSVLLIIIASVALSSFSAYKVWRNLTKEENIEIKEKHVAILKAYSLIPESDKDQIYVYHMPTYFYLLVDLLPSKVSKYFIYQEGHGMHDPNIFKEINNDVVSKSPKWVFIRQYDPSTAENVDLYKILEKDYAPKFVDKSFILYKSTK